MQRFRISAWYCRAGQVKQWLLLLAHRQRELCCGIPSALTGVGSGSCSDRCGASPADIPGHDTTLKSAVMLPVPGRMTSTLHVLLIYIICILIYSTSAEKERGLGRDGGCLFVMVCLMWLPFRAGVLRVCVCDISGLKNPRDWVGGKELKLQVFY